MCYEKLSKFEEAEQDLLFAYKLEPNNTNVLYHLANVREKLEKIDLAIQNYKTYNKLIYLSNRLISIEPSHAAAYHALGLIFDKAKEYEEAIKYFDKSIELDNMNAIYWHNRGCSFRNLGQ